MSLLTVLPAGWKRRVGCCASGLATLPEVRRRVDEAADELDEVIRAVRNMVFNLPLPAS